MPERTQPTGGRRFGYFISIILNCLMLYSVNNLHLWNIPFLTDRFSECLWAVNLSIGVSIFMYVTFMVFDRRWFRNLMQAIANVFAFVSLYVFRQVFPLDIADSTARWVNLGMVIILVIMALSVFIELMHAVRNYVRNTSA